MCFRCASLEFLGHQITSAGIVPLSRHVDAIQHFPQPKDIKQLQQFLGLVNFYRRFLPEISVILKTLTDALAGNPKTLIWSNIRNIAFEQSKRSLIKATLLFHPDVNARLSLAVDASDSHLGGSLQQYQHGCWKPLAFFSRKLSKTQQCYSTFDRELLGAFLSISHFRFLLEGRPFSLLTDHKPLMTALTKVSPPWSARQQRQLSYIAEFTENIRHTPGLTNIVADALSRPAPDLNVCSPATSGTGRVLFLNWSRRKRKTNIISRHGNLSTTMSWGPPNAIVSKS